MYHLRFITKIIYNLKRRYGVSINIITIDSNSLNLQTGKKTIVKSSTFIKRAILLPAKRERDFEYDLTFIATNKNFTYGGLFDVTKRTFIIDIKDLPLNFEITQDNYLVFDNIRYDVEFAQIFDVAKAYIITAKQATAADPFEVRQIGSSSDISLTQGVTHVVQ